MNIFHYSKEEIEKLYQYTDEQVIEKYYQRVIGKPHGFWLSIENDDDGGWKEWCISEDCFVDRLKYKYKIKLKPNANILYLDTSEKIFEFSHKFALPGSWGDIDYYKMDWKLLQIQYQGIIIAPYQWDCRLHLDTMWYYGWDCSSGCIWDIDCIESFELVDQ